MILLPWSSAHATPAVLSCTGKVTITFNPPLTDQPRATYIRARTLFSLCVSTDLAITGGSERTSTYAPSASCKTLFNSGAGETSVRWSDGEVSTFQYIRHTFHDSAQIETTFHGTIVSGAFVGQHAVEEYIFPDTDLTQCEHQGIATAPGIATIAILA